MSAFIATDGTRIEFETLPTLASVVELFNLVFEEQINSRQMITVEGKEGARELQTPLDASRGNDAAGGVSDSVPYKYQD